MGNPEQPWQPRPFVAIAEDCEDDPDFPGLCLTHEVVHRPGDQPPSSCEHEEVRLHDGGLWHCARCGHPFRPVIT